MGFYEGAKIDHQRAHREKRLSLGSLVVFASWEPINTSVGFSEGQKTILCMVVGVWSWTREGLRAMTFGVDPRTENCGAGGYVLLPSGRVGWRYAMFGDLGLTLSAA